MGGVTATMGPSAVLSVGSIRVLCTSVPAYEYADEQFRAGGIDPKELKFLVVKNPMNHQQAYEHAPSIMALDTPGPSTQNLASIEWHRLLRPRWPMDDGFEPTFGDVSTNEV
jgi:microcystin degradation protein MlrC